MAKELKWNETRKEEEIDRCIEYMRHFGGPIPTRASLEDPRLAKDADEELTKWLERGVARVVPEEVIRRAFQSVDYENTGRLDRLGVKLIGEVLGHPLLEDEVSECILCAFDLRYSTPVEGGSGSLRIKQQPGGEDGVTLAELVKWWNKESAAAAPASTSSSSSSTTPSKSSATSKVVATGVTDTATTAASAKAKV
jgi:hypothetical protein